MITGKVICLPAAVQLYCASWSPRDIGSLFLRINPQMFPALRFQLAGGCFSPLCCKFSSLANFFYIFFNKWKQNGKDCTDWIYSNLQGTWKLFLYKRIPPLNILHHRSLYHVVWKEVLRLDNKCQKSQRWKGEVKGSELFFFLIVTLWCVRLECPSCDSKNLIQN